MTGSEHEAPDASRVRGPSSDDGSERPPVGGTWSRIYAAEIGALVLVIAFLAWVAATYR